MKFGIGIIVKKKILSEPKVTKIGNHSYPEDWEYDPKTGKKLWRRYLGFKAEFMQLLPTNDDEFVSEGYLTGYKFFIASEDEVFIGIYEGEFYEDDYLAKTYIEEDPDVLTKQIIDFKNAMLKIGLWNDSFGIHATSY